MIKWDVLNIGCLSRNRFWGEDDSRVYRYPVCTSTLIRSEGINILVDPSLPPDRMAALLDSRSGLKPDDIDIVYVTHAHGDHCVGVNAFRNAAWMMAPLELLSLKSTDPGFDNLEQFVPAEREITDGVEVIELPGHTAGLAGLRFRSREGRIIIASDAVMTKDFFMAGIGYFNSKDPQQTKKTIGMIQETADIVVPGHDNYFCN